MIAVISQKMSIRYVSCTYHTFFREGPFDIQGGWDFLKKNSLFPYSREKNK